MTGCDCKNMTIVAQAEAAEPDMKLFTPAARTAVRYSDPLAWTAATAVGLALRAIGQPNETVRNETGLITIGAFGPALTIAAVAEAATEGFSSPLRYPASNPGALAGVVCIVHGLRGPSLNFVTPPKSALPAATALAHRWIDRGLPLAVLLVSRRVDRNHYPARCVVLAGAGVEGGMNQDWSTDHAAWLAA